jgi:hypothetical protein
MFRHFMKPIALTVGSRFFAQPGAVTSLRLLAAYTYTSSYSPQSSLSPLAIESGSVPPQSIS